MKLGDALSILWDLKLALGAALRPTLAAVLRAPGLLRRPRALSRAFFAHVWAAWGDGADAAARDVKDALLPGARGVVLDVGAGHGHAARYLAAGRVARYVALEPNAAMHGRIRAAAGAAGFSEAAGTLAVLGCGAADAAAETALAGGVDTLVAVLALCSVPRPAETLRALVRDVLKPGGQLLFYEHVASPRADVRFWQRVWSPVWGVFFDGCVLGQPTDEYIRALGDVWEAFPGTDAEGRRTGIWPKEEEENDSLFWHQVGRLVKRAE